MGQEENPRHRDGHTDMGGLRTKAPPPLHGLSNKTFSFVVLGTEPRVYVVGKVFTAEPYPQPLLNGLCLGE